MKSNTALRTVNNEKGAMAILSVVVMSFVVVTTLTTVYVYIVNRAKYHGRIKDAYRLTHVMEEFGKLTRQAYDTAQALPVGAPNCPNGVSGSYQYTQKNVGVPLCFPPCNGNPNCEGNNIGNLCITHLGSTYCLEAAQVSATASLEKDSATQYAKNDFFEFGIVEKTSHQDTLYSRWITRLDKFFESSVSNRVEIAAHHLTPILNREIPIPTAFGWIVREAQAMNLATTTSKDETCISSAASLQTCRKSGQGGNERTQNYASYEGHGEDFDPSICFTKPETQGCPQAGGVHITVQQCTVTSGASMGKTPVPNPGADCQFCNTSDCIRFAFCPDFMKPCGQEGRPYFREIVKIIR